MSHILADTQEAIIRLIKQHRKMFMQIILCKIT